MWEKQKRIDEIFKWADRKRSKYDEEYQQTGNPSSMRTYQRYDDICDICGWAEQGIKDVDETHMRILKNQRKMIEQLLDVKKVDPSKTFTYSEVEEWMRRMMF